MIKNEPTMATRLIWIDLLKATAIFLVILIHASSPILYQYGNVNDTYWQIANLYDSMSRMAVPLFLMASGALLLNAKKEPLKVFYKKRFLKVVIPLFAWSFLFILYKKFALKDEIDIIDHLFLSIFREEYYHLWFLYTIIGLYLIVPILKIFIKHSSYSLQIYFLILWTLSSSILPLVMHFSNFQIIGTIPMVNGYIGYLIVGYILYSLNISKKLFISSVFMIIVNIFVIAYSTSYLTYKDDKFNGFFYQDLTITTITLSIFSFIIIKYIGENIKNKFLISIIKNVSFTSLGIYLIHPIFLDILRSEKIGIELSSLNGNPLFTIPLTTLVAFILSFASIYLLRMLKVGRLVAP